MKEIRIRKTVKKAKEQIVERKDVTIKEKQKLLLEINQIIRFVSFHEGDLNVETQIINSLTRFEEMIKSDKCTIEVFNEIQKQVSELSVRYPDAEKQIHYRLEFPKEKEKTKPKTWDCC